MYLISDIGANHDNNLDRAKSLIKLAKEAGANAVKFQAWKTERFINQKAFSLLNLKSHQNKWSKSVYETYKDYELHKDWIPILADECKRNEIDFMCTPYDIESLNEIDKYVGIHKIGSGDINYYPFLQEVAKKKKPIILSTGASFLNEVIIAVNVIQKINPMLILMQCNTNYSNEKENENFSCVNVLKEYKTLFPKISVGLSSHLKTNKDILAALCLGAEFIEVHFTDGKSQSPDNEFAKTYNEFRYMVNEIKEMENVLGNTYKQVENNENETRIIQRRCLYVTKDLKSGHELKQEDVISMRPSMIDGIIPDERLVIGKKLKKDIKQGDYIKFQDIDLT